MSRFTCISYEQTIIISQLIISWFLICSVKLVDIYCDRHNISASSGLNDPAVATGISDLVYESKQVDVKPSNAIDPELAMAWAAGLDDGMWENNAPAMEKVRCVPLQWRPLLMTMFP